MPAKKKATACVARWPPENTLNNITDSKDKGQRSNKEKKKTQLVKLMSATFLSSKRENCKNGKFKINMILWSLSGKTESRGILAFFSQ